MAHDDVLWKRKEYWVNVYEYETVKNTQFYSHCLPDKIEANFRATMRQIARPDSRVVYRIHVKMKKVKGFSREYPLKMIKGHSYPIANVKPKYDSFWTDTKIAEYDKFFNMRLDS